MELTVAIPEYASDVASQTVWSRLAKHLGNEEGIAFYSHPILAEAGRVPPELTILAQPYQPIVIRVLDANLDQIHELNDETLVLDGVRSDSPVLELDDFAQSLNYKFNRHRDVRRLYEPVMVLALPNVSRAAFVSKFAVPTGIEIVWSDLQVSHIFKPLMGVPEGEKWRLCRAIFQTATPIKGAYQLGRGRHSTIGSAIDALRNRVALLDQKQLKVAVEIPPGPQRIRGLAGTGKTVLLAMRAANIHLRNPDATILFTFYTRSLYQMVRDLIGRFYRDHVGHEPDWSRLHVRHAWGARDEPGVYSEWAGRSGVAKLDFRTAQMRDFRMPLRACALHALSEPERIEAIYDYVLVDEAQDLPAEFMQVLFRLTKTPRRIYFAQDTMQNLGTVDTAAPEEIFGRLPDGKPAVTLDGTYPGGIEQDFVLDTSYRCTLSTLMLAHGLGLGIYRRGGPVQMLFASDDWKAIGYDKVAGAFRPGEKVVVCRSARTTPTNLEEIYEGKQQQAEIKVCISEDEETEWIAERIRQLVVDEKVRPEDIMVVALDARRIRTFAAALGTRLAGHGVQSQQAGATSGASQFREENSVTVSSTYRAKGNEAPIVFIAQMQELYAYAEEKVARNLVFTAVSRSMGWVRLSGSGLDAARAQKEISNIRTTQPCFKFILPSPDQVRKVDAELSRQLKEKQRATLTLRELAELDEGALSTFPPEEIARMIDKLRRASRETE